MKAKNQYYILIESVAIKDLKSLHKKVMMKHHSLVGIKVALEYNDGTKGSVRCTFSDEVINVFLNGKYVDRNVLSFNILKQNLIDSELPIKGFKTIIFNREKYEVVDVTENSSMGNAISVKCDKIG